MGTNNSLVVTREKGVEGGVNKGLNTLSRRERKEKKKIPNKLGVEGNLLELITRK